MKLVNAIIVILLIITAAKVQTNELQQIIEVYNTDDSSGGEVLLTANLLYLPERRVQVGLLALVTMEGNVIMEKVVSDGGFQNPIMFNDTTIMGHGEPSDFLTFWNPDTNEEYAISKLSNQKKGHHEVIYNKVRDTFLTIGRESVNAEGVYWTVDTLWEFDWTGKILWEWKMSDYVTSYQETECSNPEHIGTSHDYGHSNSIDWNPETNLIYLNVRHLNNVWAIEYPTGNILWKAGQNGDLILWDKKGRFQESLWYHSHDFKRIPGEKYKFILFDNNYHNPEPGGSSRIVEVELEPLDDHRTMVMKEIWSWEAPMEYYSPLGGSVQRLPNGNRLASFGSRMYRYGRTGPYPDGGAVLVEVDDNSIVWELKLPTEWEIYRATKINIPGVISEIPPTRYLLPFLFLLSVIPIIYAKRRRKL
jgi:hypothetical protein